MTNNKKLDEAWNNLSDQVINNVVNGYMVPEEIFALGYKTAQKEAEVLKAAIKEIENKIGMCIYGSSDTSHDPEVAYRQGSHSAWCETGMIAKEAREKYESGEES